MSDFEKTIEEAKVFKSRATGFKIRRLRTSKKVSAKELGEACGVNENAIRNYELGVRSINEKKLLRLAEHLNVSVAALRDRNIIDKDDVMHVLFELSDRYAFMPTFTNQEVPYALQSKDETLTTAMKVWYLKLWEFTEKKISSDDLDDWKAAFTTKGKGNSDDKTPEHRYSDIERIIFLRKALQDLQLIFNDQLELIYNNANKKDIGLARGQLMSLKNTMNTIINQELEKYG